MGEDAIRPSCVHVLWNRIGGFERRIEVPDFAAAFHGKERTTHESRAVIVDECTACGFRRITEYVHGLGLAEGKAAP